MQSVPLNIGLNVAVMHIASRLFPLGFDVSDDAPSTFEELKERLDAGKRLIVYAGGSDRTIYADREVNWCFRAWHDWCHWAGGHDLSFAGEHAVSEMQCEHIRALYGDNRTTAKLAAIIQAEVMAQAQYHNLRGRFPEDQMAFVKAYLADPERALTYPGW